MTGAEPQTPAVSIRDPSIPSDSAVGDSGSTREVLRHDFGITPIATILRHTFQIPNKSKSVWTVEQVRTSCRCTVPKIDRKTVSPGGSLSVTVEYHSPSTTKDDVQRVTLILDGGTVNYDLEVAAAVREPIVVGRSRFDLTIASSESRTIPLLIDNYCDSNWTELRGAVHHNSGGEVEWLALDPPSRVSDDQGEGKSTAPRERWATAFAIDGSRVPLGTEVAGIDLAATDASGNRFTKRVTVSASARPAVRIIPRTLFVPDAAPGAMCEKQLLCAFADERNYVESDAIQLEHDLPFPVELVWKPNDALGAKLEGRLVLGPIATATTADSATIRGTISLSFGDASRYGPQHLSVIIATVPPQDLSTVQHE
ncbi:MAG: DUF1573 domain-containing protein [Planctomycetaceae bacterium]